jgi:predicted TIM-barrel fold metal-dependent hydrolase
MLRNRDAAQDIPSFCSHEHWGSLSAIGFSGDAFHADLAWGVTPARPVTVVDIVNDPYLGGWLANSGFDARAAAVRHGYADIYDMAAKDPGQAFRALEKPLKRVRLTGGYQAIRRGLLALYDIDIARCSSLDWRALDSAVARNYGRMFDWYREAMKVAGFSRLIRLMWPEHYVSGTQTEDAQNEQSFTDTMMRVDAFMELWRNDYPRKKALVAMGGVDPRDAGSVKAFLAGVFRKAEAGGCLGTKQAMAYRRTLHYPAVDPAKVCWSGERTPDEINTWQNWVMNACLQETADRNWPHHCHVGTHNLPNSSPLPLQELVPRYPAVKFVLLHCHPYIDEAGNLAKHYPNVYLDACWQVILNPEFLRKALRAWLGYVPLHKITIGHDATSVEMAAGACSMVREIVAETLEDRRHLLGLRKEDIPAVIADLLHNNAVDLYGIGERVEV